VTNRADLRPVLLAALLCWVGGCASIDRAMLGVPEEGPTPYAALDEPPKPPSAWDKFLVAGGFKKKEVSPYMRPVVPPEAQKAYDDAKKLYDAGKYKESEEAAHKLAKKWRDTVLEEDALFLKAESQYALKRYSKAQDTYAEIFERFPSTRYMDNCTAKLFEMSRYWLRFPEVVKSAEVQAANFEDPRSSPLPKPNKKSFELTRAVPFLPNLADRSRPVFDTEGRALEALKSIWLNDPTGPLADDALMLSASYHLREGDYQEADRFYDILREEYPKSPHLEDAFVLGSHVKLMSYQGAAYDGKTLEEAERLKESTLKLFPQTAERERLSDELRKIEDAKARRQWETVRFYDRKGSRHEKSVAFACHTLLTDFPNSQYAPQARKIWQGLPPETKKHLPPLPNEPARSAAPDLEPVPPLDPGPYTERDAPPGKVKL